MLMYLLSSVLDEFPAPPGSAYPGARPGQSGQPGSEQDQRPYGQAAGTRPYGQDQRPGITPSRFAFLFVGRDFDTITSARSQMHRVCHLVLSKPKDLSVISGQSLHGCIVRAFKCVCIQFRYLIMIINN